MALKENWNLPFRGSTFAAVRRIDSEGRFGRVRPSSHEELNTAATPPLVTWSVESTFSNGKRSLRNKRRLTAERRSLPCFWNKKRLETAASTCRSPKGRTTLSVGYFRDIDKSSKDHNHSSFLIHCSGQ